ncbi:MAG: TlpA family protein disulfide reductase [Gammaproteobacteria bacterium]|nr:TlpA family protein disulfide reductase [Gammaproteobacteria bacterium]MCW8988818.1 TlpA family protein disulfide reductase [Gammaproteobacteria bacterium]
MKNNMLKTLIVVGFTLVFATSTSYAASQTISGKAANFTLKSRSGKNIKLSELRGEVVMLNFWASWCGPCRKEMPLLEKIHKKYKRLGFTLLGVNVEQNSSAAKKYLKDVKVSFPVLFDSTNKTSKLYDVSAMPTTILIDRNGNKRFLHKGYKPGYENDYQKQIKKLLRE